MWKRRCGRLLMQDIIGIIRSTNNLYRCQQSIDFAYMSLPSQGIWDECIHIRKVFYVLRGLG